MDLWLRRAMAAVVLCGFFAIAVILLLSDRTGGVASGARDLAVEAGQRFEERYEVDVIDRDSIPGTFDQIGHAVLWGTGMLLVGWFLRRRVPLFMSALFVAAMSFFAEAGQAAFSQTRQFQVSDLIGNFVGIAIASVIVGVAIIVYRWFNGDDRVYRDAAFG